MDGERNALMKGILRRAVLIVALAFSLAAYASTAYCADLTVGAASSLVFPLKEIARGYEKATGRTVALSFGSTGILSGQIRHGAPFDIFFAADMAHIRELASGGFVEQKSVTVYARGRVVIAVNKGSGVRAASLQDLLSPEIRRVSIANPEFAPYGRAAMEALKSAGLWDRLRPKLVYGENVRQTLQFILTLNAQAGIVALSVAGVPEVTYTEIDSSLYSPIEQGAAIVSKSANASLAGEFLKYLTGPEGRPVMEKYGFQVP